MCVELRVGKHQQCTIETSSSNLVSMVYNCTTQVKGSARAKAHLEPKLEITAVKPTPGRLIIEVAEVDSCKLICRCSRGA